MRLWIDDVREAPSGWVWRTNSRTAILTLEWCKLLNERPKAVSFDHDLGLDDTTRPVVLWMCENEFWPVECYVHSANPVGIEWLRGMIQRYAPEGTLK
jgi:hypothetical protein